MFLKDSAAGKAFYPAKPTVPKPEEPPKDANADAKADTKQDAKQETKK